MLPAHEHCRASAMSVRRFAETIARHPKGNALRESKCF
jgi:hypothetical protein